MVDASQVSNGNGVGPFGDGYVIVRNAASPPKVYRLFGDHDGDADVDAADFGAFRTAFGSAGVVFDFDNDGDVDATDFGAFRLRFGVGV